MEKIRIGLDARFALGERRGIGNYSLELFRHLTSLDSNFEFIFYSDRQDTYNLLNFPNSKVRVLDSKIYPIWEQIYLPIALIKDKISLFHAVGNTAPVFVPKQIKVLVSICDVMYMKGKDIIPVSKSIYQRAGRLYRRLVVPKVAKKANHLLTISEFSRNDICQTLEGIPPSKISVTLLALPSNFSSQAINEEVPPLKGTPYLLHLGGLDPRKNTGLVVRNFLALKKSGELAESLIILGLKNLNFLSLDPTDSDLATRWVHLPGFVPETEIPYYYRHASAFLFPSLYEGFGIPLLEAMSCMVPIITSNVSSLPEISGNAALYVNPNDSREFQSAIRELLGSHELRQALIQEGQTQISKFTWERTAEQTLCIYKDLLLPPLLTF